MLRIERKKPLRFYRNATRCNATHFGSLITLGLPLGGKVSAMLAWNSRCSISQSEFSEGYEIFWEFKGIDS